MISQTRIAALVLCCFYMFATEPVQSQTVTDIPRQARCQEPANFPVVDAATGVIVSAVVRACEDRIDDLTQGADAPAQGQLLFLIPSRQENGAATIGAIIRAFPNKAYPLHPNVPKINDGALVWWGRTPTTSWGDVPFILPFIPTKAGVVTSLEGGRQIYGYGGLVALSGYHAAMAPLNNNSVIIGVAGHSFANLNGLQAFLGGLTTGGNGWVEIIYAQADDPNLQLRRAFVPLMSSTKIATNWSFLARQNPLSVVSDRNKTAEFAAVGLALLAMAAGQAFADGDTPKNCRTVYDNNGENGSLRSLYVCD